MYVWLYSLDMQSFPCKKCGGVLPADKASTYCRTMSRSDIVPAKDTAQHEPHDPWFIIGLHRLRCTRARSLPDFNFCNSCNFSAASTVELDVKLTVGMLLRRVEDKIDRKKEIGVV